MHAFTFINKFIFNFEYWQGINAELRKINKCGLIKHIRLLRVGCLF